MSFRFNPLYLLTTVLFVSILGTATAGNAINPAIQPYVDFLSKKPLTAKEYVLSLFKTHDIVIICERDHRDITQYELYLDIISDPYFTSNVGVLFTEVGTRSLNPELNRFLHTNGLDSAEVARNILHLRRNMLYYPTWHNYNWSIMAEGIYRLNASLSEEKKVSWYPADIYFSMESPANKKQLETAYAQYYDYYQRDSLMACYVIAQIKEMKKLNPRQKALVIMNYRHAFNHNYQRTKGVPEQNVGRFLFEAFPGKCANVMVNQFALAAIRSDNDVAVVPTCNGKWDAAFSTVGLENAGFDFNGSPFGNDSFDHDPRTVAGTTYRDIFTGFVYYRAIPDFRIVTGVPHIAEDGFDDEYEKREAVFYEIMQKNNPHEARKYIWELNEKKAAKEDFLPQLKKEINKWLE